MARYLVRRFGQYVLVLLAAILINFALPRLAPGSVVDFVVPPAEAGSLTTEQRAEILELYGLGDPLPQQFWNYLSGLPQGEWGISVIYGRPVLSLLLERLPWTLLLVGSSVVLSTLIGTHLGFRSGWRRGTRRDVGTMSWVLLIQAMPGFFIAMLLVLLFSVHLEWFPVYGALPTESGTGLENLFQVGRRLALPLVSLTALSIGAIYLVARPAIVSEYREDYVLMAACKGLGWRDVRRHAQRNALIPVSTIAMLNVGDLVGGAVVIETVFAYPGIGRLIFDSVVSRDFPVLQGAFFLLAVTVIGANLLADLTYPWLDPRVRRNRQRAGTA